MHYKGGVCIYTKEIVYVSGEVWKRGGRNVNQDSIVIQEIATCKGRLFLAAVCDGMGGCDEGENASGFVVQQLVAWLYDEILELLQKHVDTAGWRRSWYRCFYQVNQKLNAYAENNGIFTGTTMTMLFCWKRRYYVFHIGDSRVYRIRKGVGRNNGIKQLTQDDVWQEHVLKRCIGAGRTDMPEYLSGRLRREEGFLICSDGLYRRMRNAEFAEALLPKHIKTEKDIKRVLLELAERAQTRGERDNISAVYMVCK